MTNTATFATVGVSTKNGNITKFRFTNRGAEGYGDILIKEGHTNVLFMDLPQPMTKADAVAAFVAQYPQHADIRMPGAGAAERGEQGDKPRRARREKAAKLTPEQIAAAKLAAKRARDAAAKREKRAAARAADTAEADSTNKLDAALAALDEAMNDGADAPVADTADAAETV